MGRRRGGDRGLRGESRNGGSSLRGIDLETEASGEEEIRFVGGTGWTPQEADIATRASPRLITSVSLFELLYELFY